VWRRSAPLARNGRFYSGRMPAQHVAKCVEHAPHVRVLVGKHILAIHQVNDGCTVRLEHKQATVRQFAAVDRVVVEWHLFMQSGKGVAVTGGEGFVEMRPTHTRPSGKLVTS